MDPIFTAIDQNDITTISSLLSTASQSTTTMSATSTVSELLLQQHQNHHQQLLPVQYACEKGHVEIFDLLLSAMVTNNILPFDPKLQDGKNGFRAKLVDKIFV